MYPSNAPASLKPGPLLAYAVAHRKALSTSFLNQAVSSGANFALALVLVRVLSVADYGSYCLGVAVCYLYAGLGNSMLLIPMVVHTPDKSQEDRLPYAVRILVAVGLFAVGTLVLTALGAFLVSVLLPAGKAYRTFAITVAAASVCYVVKDYFVRQAYLVRAEARALAISCSIALSLAALLAVAWIWNITITAEGALIVFAASQLAGAAMGFTLAHLPVRSFCWRRMLADLSVCWSDGRWVTGSSVVGWAQSQAYVYLTFLVLGAADAARANAARLLVAPFLLLTPAINQLTIPRLAEMRTRDPRGMVRAGAAITIVLLGVAALYTTVLLMTSESLIPAILGPTYRNMGPPVAAWCLVLFAMLMRDGTTTLFQAMKRFRALTSVNALCAGVSLISVLGLMHVWGVTGAILGGAAGDFTQAALLWRSLRDEPTPSLGGAVPSGPSRTRPTAGSR